jgi:hypothetical protein
MAAGPHLRQNKIMMQRCFMAGLIFFGVLNPCPSVMGYSAKSHAANVQALSVPLRVAFHRQKSKPDSALAKLTAAQEHYHLPEGAKPLFYSGVLDSNHYVGQTDGGLYPSYRLPDKSVVVYKYAHTERPLSVILSRIVYELSIVLGFPDINVVQFYSAAGEFGSLEAWFGRSLESTLGDYKAVYLQEELGIFKHHAPAVFYEEVLAIFGGSFVRGDIFRVFSLSTYDSSKRDAIRAVHLPIKTSIRWIDYDRAFQWLSSEGNDIPAYLNEHRSHFITHGWDLVLAIAQLSDDTLARLINGVFEEGLNQIQDAKVVSELRNAQFRTLAVAKSRRDLFLTFSRQSA